MLPAAPTGIKSRGKKETSQVTLYDNSMMARVITRKRKLNPVTFIHRSLNKNRKKNIVVARTKGAVTIKQSNFKLVFSTILATDNDLEVVY